MFVYLQKEANDLCLRVLLRAEGAPCDVPSPCLVMSIDNCHIVSQSTVSWSLCFSVGQNYGRLS